MKITKEIILSALLILGTLSLAACSNAKNDYKSITDLTKKQQESLDAWAKTTIDNGTFDQKVEVLTAYTKQKLFKSDLAAKLSSQLRDQEQVEFKKGNIEKAYEMAKKIWTGMALPENTGTLSEVAKSYSKIAFDKKDYQKAIEASMQVLQMHWDEDAMGIKLAAEVELLNAAVASNDLKQAKTYYSDILGITSLKGNEKLAAKYRASAEKYSDKFPTDTKAANQPAMTTTIK